MLRKALFALLGLLLIGVAIAGVMLITAHDAIRQERAALPSAANLSAALMAADGPRRLSVVHTAIQPMPRSAVLEPGADPDPTAPYVMTHPAFVLEWADGRILLVDVGMSNAAALSFGRPLEMLGGAGPIEPQQSAATALGAAASRVTGIVFSHLHIDHVDGLLELCAAHAGTITVFMTEAQAERTNYTTRGGRELIRSAGCARVEILGDGPTFDLPGFPGVAVLAAGGHTPGSQIVAASVGEAAGARRYLFAGDIINHNDGVRHQIGKPWYYSMFIVPEDRERLHELRQYLEQLRETGGYDIVAAHDYLNTQTLGIPPYAPR